MKNLTSLTLTLSILLLALSCGQGSTETTNEENPSSNKEEAMEAAIPESVSLEIEGNDLMQFNTDKLEAIEGQQVTLTLKHTGQMSVDVMGHNWVLLATGTDAATFGGAAVTAKETGYIPQDMTENVIAFTKTIGGGEETTVTFEAPKAGYYTFICSFPGHYGVMQGSFVSAPR
jgi:azurin